MAVFTKYPYSGSSCKITSTIYNISNVVSAISDFLESVTSLTAFTFNRTICGFLESYFNGNILLVTAMVIYTVYYNIKVC